MAREKTWQQSINNKYQVTTGAAQTKAAAWYLKALLTGQVGGLTGTGLWTVYGSCDGAGNFGNGDLVDRWGTGAVDESKLVFGSAGSNHSWMVLRSPATMNGNTFYLLITFDSVTTTECKLVMAKTAFSSGTATANPTSVDSWLMNSSPTFNAVLTAFPAWYQFHMCLSSTGDFAFFPTQTLNAFVPGNQSELGVMVVAPTGCDVSDQFPIYTMKNYSTSGAFNINPIASNSGTPTRNGVGTAASNGVLGFDGASVTLGTQVPDLLTGKFFAMPSWIQVSINASRWHLRGRLPDIQLIPNSVTGTPFNGLTQLDGSGNIEYVQVGCFFLPLSSIPLGIF